MFVGQDTYIALRALIEYTNRKRLRDVSALSVAVDAVALHGHTRTLTLRNDNLALMHSIEIPEAWGTVKVTARGTGYALLQLSVQYNVDVPRFQTPPPLRAFELRTQASFYGRNQSHVDYRSCASWTLVSESVRSGMAVLEVGVPTGYMVQQQRLDAYVLSRAVPTLQRAKYQPDKILFYFDYVRTQCTLHAGVAVGAVGHGGAGGGRADGLHGAAAAPRRLRAVARRAHAAARQVPARQDTLLLRLRTYTVLVSQSVRSGMAVLEVGVPTGYMVQQQRNLLN
ncbi:unnamed protein product [Parnassius mnemosyne]|uniref:Alpha-macroglobulin receptor-binding domain-containing protein n=1 Tax=Parnassius mnemosyne TaxID=213953 RepID=A0AAV1KRN1_9NEOP